MEELAMAVITGTNGNDDLTGGSGGDTILALDGNDILRSGTGFPGEFHGGRGDDSYFLTRGDTVVEAANEGIDTVNTNAAEYVLPANVENLAFTGSGPFRGHGNALNNKLTGGADDDRLSGGAGNNQFDGGAGSDWVLYDAAGISSVIVNLASGQGTNGLGGADTYVRIENVAGTTSSDIIRGDNNANILLGNGGFDQLDGGGGNDTIVGSGSLIGGAGVDLLTGGSGNDVLDGGIGGDTMSGGLGNDTFFVDSLSDVLIDDGGTDAIILNLGGTYTMPAGSIENLIANFGGILVIANSLNNQLGGGGGSQVFRGLGGNNRIDGGADVDFVDYSTAAQAVSVFLNHGTATNNGFGGVDTLSNVEGVIGTDFNDTIYGDGASNRLAGGNGADVLVGLGGDDLLDGGAGASNEMIGGQGDDQYTQSAAGDTLYEAAGEGTDSVFTTLAFLSLRDNFENLSYGGSASFTGAGNDLANTIRGGLAADQLSGLGGDDILYGNAGAANTLIGGAGNDVYVSQTSGDSIVEAAGGGADMVVTALSQFVLADNVEALVFTGGAAFGLGNAGNNSMVGSDGADTLYAGAGDDRVIGRSGADELQGGAGADQFGYVGGETGLDRILDFQSGADKILLFADYYDPTATVDFVNGTSAQSANSTFLYNSGTGIVSFDADGNGAGAAVQIAQLNPGTIVAAGDFGFF
jgi:Ca2+-binding RTX toxin-like protein